jgi:hypothetical protein
VRERSLWERKARDASNAKAKRDLGWWLRDASWRQGFVALRVGGTRTDPAARNE